MPRLTPALRAALLTGSLLAGAALAPAGVALAKGSGSGGHGGHGSSHSHGAVSGSHGSSHRHDGRRSGVVVGGALGVGSMYPGASAGLYGYGGICAARDEFGNCVNYGARAPEPRYVEPPGGSYVGP